MMTNCKLILSGMKTVFKRLAFLKKTRSKIKPLGGRQAPEDNGQGCEHQENPKSPEISGRRYGIEQPDAQKRTQESSRYQDKALAYQRNGYQAF